MSFFILAIVVGIVFYALSNGFRQAPAGDAHKQITFNDAKFLISLLAKIAKADGEVKATEAAYISQMLDILTFELNGQKQTRDELKKIYEHAKNSHQSVYEIAKIYKNTRKLNSNECQSVIIYLLNLAYADGFFSPSEAKVIDDICKAFNINEKIKQSLFLKFEQEFNAYFGAGSFDGGYRNYDGFKKQSKQKTNYKNYYKNSNSQNTQNTNHSQKNPYEILELPNNASFDEVKKQYRKLARKYHPDFLGLDASKGIINDATKKLQEINQAYETIKQKENK